jgi:hypothetical protein
MMMSLEDFDTSDNQTQETDDSSNEQVNNTSKYNSAGVTWSDNEILKIIKDLYDEHGKVVLSMFDERDELPSSWKAKNTFSSWSRAKELAGVGEPTIECHSCGERYRKISRHWYETSCSYPEISDRQKSMLIGLMMGDATLGAKDQSNPFVGIVNTNIEFLKWIHEELDSLSYTPTLLSTAKEKYEQNIESGFTSEESANLGKYNDVYYLNTVSHKEFVNLDWISEGKKVIPKEIPIDSMIVKMWYCSDGSLHWRSDRGKAEARITNVTENDDLEKFKKMFSEAGFDVRVGGKEIQFNIKQTKRLFDWMGEPPNGMEYKWEYENRDGYDEEKQKVK